MSHTEPATDLHTAVAATFVHSPLVGVVRTATYEDAERQARLFIAGGIRLVEITFTVPDATRLVRQLLAQRDAAAGSEGGAYHVGMGTVTGAERARQALAAGAEFIDQPERQPARSPRRRARPGCSSSSAPPRPPRWSPPATPAPTW